MHYFILLLVILNLSSCFGGSQIIIDEEKVSNRQQQSVLDKEFEEKTIQPSSSVTHLGNNDAAYLEDRNTLDKVAEIFSTEDISTPEEEKTAVNTGLRSYSSRYARDVITAEKANNPELSFVVYFAFDSDKLSDTSKRTLQLHKDILAKYPQLNMRLEGHTDPVGTRAYNLSLGELRAIAVRDWLAKDADVVSFGEEKPISSEDAKNRRVEIIYK